MEILLLGFVSIVIIIAMFQAIRLHKNYAGTVYTSLFSNYFEYFYNYYFRQNVSTSHWLKQELGFHRLLYNSVLNKEGHVKQNYVTILCLQGAFVIRDMRSHGEFIGKAKDKCWFLQKKSSNEVKKCRIKNPQIELKQHIQYQKHQLDIDCTGIIVFNQESDFSKIQCDVPIIHYNDLIEYIKQQPKKYTEQQLITAFEKVSKKIKYQLEGEKMAYILLIAGLISVICSKILYNKRCIAGTGVPYTNKEKLLLYGGYALLIVSLILAALNKA